MRLPDLVESRFVRRLNRFAALVNVDGIETMVHVANSGRMKELLVEGCRMYLKPVSGDHRKTAFDLALVDLGNTLQAGSGQPLASADARLPNVLLHESLAKGSLRHFKDYDTIRREVVYHDSRLDLALEGPGGRCYIEAKSVTLVQDDVGLFPDAPTTRGTKHVLSLLRATREGHRAAVVFVVQRNDAHALVPNDAADPEFGRALRHAVSEGVETYAYRCRVTTEEVVLSDELPVYL